MKRSNFSFVHLLQRKSQNDTLTQSAALALGQLALSAEQSEPDAEYSKALLTVIGKSRDAQTRYFALIALGQIGGESNLEALMRLYRTEKGATQSWAAIAMGLLAHAAPPDEASQRDGAGTRVGKLLRADLDSTANPDERSALAVALGLARYTPAAPQMRVLLKKNRNREEVGGYFCVGLALMDDLEAAPLMVDVLRDSRRRPLLMAQAATGLARLQRRDAAALLHPLLRRGDHRTITLASAASALGWIGDASSVPPLLAVLDDESIPKLLRAFAGASLGMIADDDLLPWNAQIGRDMNYRAMVETLSNGSSGVLDIL